MYQLVEMVEPNVDKEFSCLRVAGKSVKASSMAISIADGSISSVLSKALHVLSQYRYIAIRTTHDWYSFTYDIKYSTTLLRRM